MNHARHTDGGQALRAKRRVTFKMADTLYQNSPLRKQGTFFNGDSEQREENSDNIIFSAFFVTLR